MRGNGRGKNERVMEENRARGLDGPPPPEKKGVQAKRKELTRLRGVVAREGRTF